MKTPRWIAIPCLLITGAALPAQVPTINSFGVDATTVPFGSQPTLTWDVTDATTVRISPGAGPVGPAGSVTVAAPGLVSLVGSGEMWKYLDTGADLGTSDQPNSAAAWFNGAYNDGSWLTGATPLGYGNDNSGAATPTDQSADLRYGPNPSDDPLHPNKANDPASKWLTTYFRKQFEVTASELAAIQALHVGLRRDDGALVYLNGVEIIRQNLPPGPVTAATVATVAVGGNEFGTLFRVEVPKSRLLAGANTLAVEIHQRVGTSSDIVMDARVDAILPAETTPLLVGGPWRYLDDGSDQGTGWRTTAVDDAFWKEGHGVFGYNNSTNNAAGTTAGANTVARFGNDPNAKPITTYFRKKFHADGIAALASEFTLFANYDDGMVVYLNGTEIARAFMPAGGEIGATTPAANHEGDYALPALAAGADISVADAFTVAGVLREGENTLAVEVHQSAAASSDMSFNLAFTASDGFNVTVLVKPFDTWSYLDTGEDLGTYDGFGVNPNPWVTDPFAEDGWKVGVTEIGYGDPNDGRAPATALDYGPDLAAKTITSYFRKSVVLPSLTDYPSLTLELYRDDAAAVFVNGHEVFRDASLPADAAFDTPATSTSNGTVMVNVPTSAFVSGLNLIAVEVHQQSGASSDVFFDLALYGNGSALTRTYTLVAENANGSVTRELTVAFAPLTASPVELMTSLGGAVSPEPGWNFPDIWYDHLAPAATRDYRVTGAFSRVLATGDGTANATFSGRSLTIGPRGILVVNNSAGAAATVNDLRLDGAEIQSSNNGAAGTVQSRILDGSITVLSPSVINPGGTDRILEITADLSGAGDLIVAANLPAADTPNAPSGVVLSGDNAAFTGNWDISSHSFRPATATALGGSAAFPNTLILHSGAVLDPEAALLAFHTSATLRNTGGANPAQIVLDQDVQFATLTLGTDLLPAGTYTYGALSLAEQAYFVDGPGRLTVGMGEPGDSDGDGLADAWELANLGSLAFTGMDDPDADGFDNLAEFKLGTRPADGSSFYAFTGPVAVTVGGAPAARLVFPAHPTWTVQPQWSNSLLGGQWQNLGPPLTGAASYTVDDTGSLTGQPPYSAGARIRFYRARLFVP